MRTLEEHGSQHVHELVLDDDAYNSVGERLVNDKKQSKRTLAATVLAGVGCAAIVLAILL